MDGHDLVVVMVLAGLLGLMSAVGRSRRGVDEGLLLLLLLGGRGMVVLSGDELVAQT